MPTPPPDPPPNPAPDESSDAVHLGNRESAPPAVEPKARVMIGFYVLVAAGLSVLHLLVHEKVGPLARVALPIVEHALLAGVLIAAVIAITTTLTSFVIDRLESAAARYNLRRVVSLV